MEGLNVSLDSLEEKMKRGENISDKEWMEACQKEFRVCENDASFLKVLEKYERLIKEYKELHI